MTPSDRSIALLRKEGHYAENVEKVIRMPGKGWARKNTRVYRKDLFGAIDILAIHPLFGKTVGVQATTASHVNARLKKMQGEKVYPMLSAWLRCGNLLEIHGWRAPTKTIRRWRLERVPVTLTDLTPTGED